MSHNSFIYLDPEERLMHLNQLSDCLLLFKRTMGSIETLQKEDVDLIYSIFLFLIDSFISGSLTNRSTKDDSRNQPLPRRNRIE